MAVRNILKYGDERLSKVAKPVTQFDDDLKSLLDDMRETMRVYNGIGLAGPQIGILRRIVVIEIDDLYLELINPEIISSKGEQYEDEGCLSVPKYYDKVKRPKVVSVKAFDRDGKEFTITGKKLLARCLCHEIDHLDGILFIDKSENGNKYKERK